MSDNHHFDWARAAINGTAILVGNLRNVLATPEYGEGEAAD